MVLDFHSELENDIGVRAASSGLFKVQAFAEELASRLEDAEEVFDFSVEPVSCIGANRKKLEILGYAEDGGDNSLIVLVGHYFGTPDSTLTLTAARKIFDYGLSFIKQSLNGKLLQILEPSSKEFEYAEYFNGEISQYDQLRFFLITDGAMSDRIKTIDDEEVNGKRVTFEIWDWKRFADLQDSPSGKEDTNIDFTDWLPDGLPVLASQDSSDTYTYVGIIPGTVLAEIYRRHGTRLLESNVRTFLSARGKVNQGIQKTLRQYPERFLAYNNGLSTTASEIAWDGDDLMPRIMSIKNWQIVNGGQTTASLAHYLKNNPEGSLDDVFVQMKLVLVATEEAAERVSEISRFANNQNAVSESDFFSNSEYHRHMSALSARIRAPRAHGAQYGTQWFYERTRGEYSNERMNRTAAEMRKFDREVPKSQRITKTDWAKYLNSWDLKPHIVSKGAQTNFLEFAKAVSDDWDNKPERFGEDYFKTTVAKAILFNHVRSLVMKADWYESGYLANITTYTLAKLAYAIPRQFPGLELDFQTIWNRQHVARSADPAIDAIARGVLDVLTAPDRPQANVTQWAKQQACWHRVQMLPCELPDSLRSALTSTADVDNRRRESRRLQTMDSGFKQMERVLAVKREVWDRALEIGVAEGMLTEAQAGVCRKLQAQNGFVPTERQSKAAIKALEALATCGFIADDDF